MIREEKMRAAVLEQVLRRIAARYGRTYADVRAAYLTRRGWHADAAPTEKFRVLPDGTIDLHPSQWSVIA